MFSSENFRLRKLTNNGVAKSSNCENRAALLYFSADTIFNSASSARIHAALPIITNRERRPGAAFTQISASSSVLNNLVWRTRADLISSPINCRRTDRLTSFFPASARFFLLRIDTNRSLPRFALDFGCQQLAYKRYYCS